MPIYVDVFSKYVNTFILASFIGNLVVNYEKLEVNTVNRMRIGLLLLMADKRMKRLDVYLEIFVEDVSGERSERDICKVFFQETI